MIEKVISGGQTGADQAGWRAAKAFGITTGGWMPLGFRTEDGPRPEFAAEFGAKEKHARDHMFCAERNVHESHVTLWFGNPNTPDGTPTLRTCHDLQRPMFLYRWIEGLAAYTVAEWIKDHPECTILNIAGNREKESPGIGANVESFMREVFRRLGFQETGK